MSRWTKLAALFSIIASMVTIYDMAFRPKNAPSIWSSVAQSVGLAPPMALVSQPLPMVAECGKAKVAGMMTPFVPVRVAPGREHKEIERLKAGAAVLVLQETAGWYLVQINQGLNSSTTGWALVGQVDKVACGSASIPAAQPGPKKT
jgi:Bacterial SH3 domain